MSRGTAWFLHFAAALVGLGGLAYGWMLLFCEPADEFALHNHPWQGEALALHVLAAPLLLFACGLVWRGHVWARIQAGLPERRRTGIALALLFLPMAVTGYLLQVSADPWWRGLWSWTHMGVAAPWTLLYLVHQVRLGRPAPCPVSRERDHAGATVKAMSVPFDPETGDPRSGANHDVEREPNTPRPGRRSAPVGGRGGGPPSGEVHPEEAPGRRRRPAGAGTGAPRR